jgi:hypothetical protein
MSETIDAIQARLSPSRLVAGAKETVKEATVGRLKGLTQRAASEGGACGDGGSRIDLLQAAKRNPIPVAIAGVVAMAVLLRAVKRSRNGTHAARTVDASARGRFRSNGIGRNKTQFVTGVCAGLACWGAFTTRRTAAARPAAGPGFMAGD